MRSVWTSRRAVSLHVALVFFVPGCVALTWWQVSRALGGNTLSWVYTVEWPIFACYATFMWWKLVHDASGAPVPGTPAPGTEEPVPGATVDATVDATAGDRPEPARASSATGLDPARVDAPPGEADRHGQSDEEDEELAAYNRYLAELNASGRQKRW